MPGAIPTSLRVSLNRQVNRSGPGLPNPVRKMADTWRGGAGLAGPERDELVRLRRENKQLRLERDILSKAAAWFARETGTLPSGSSGS